MPHRAHASAWVRVPGDRDLPLLLGSDYARGLGGWRLSHAGFRVPAAADSGLAAWVPCSGCRVWCMSGVRWNCDVIFRPWRRRGLFRLQSANHVYMLFPIYI